MSELSNSGLQYRLKLLGIGFLLLGGMGLKYSRIPLVSPITFVPLSLPSLVRTVITVQSYIFIELLAIFLPQKHLFIFDTMNLDYQGKPGQVLINFIMLYNQILQYLQQWSLNMELSVNKIICNSLYCLGISGTQLTNK